MIKQKWSVPRRFHVSILEKEGSELLGIEFELEDRTERVVLCVHDASVLALAVCESIERVESSGCETHAHPDPEELS